MSTDTLLRAILSVSSRQAFPPDKLIELIGTGTKQLRAFNLCDGTTTQSEVAKALKLDAGNFSRTVARWIDLGIIFRIGEGRDSKLLHVYPLVISKKGGQKRDRS